MLMTGIGFVSFAILVVGGSLFLTELMTLLATRQVARAAVTAPQARHEPANRLRTAELEQRPRTATELEIVARPAVINEVPIGAIRMVEIGEGNKGFEDWA